MRNGPSSRIPCDAHSAKLGAHVLHDLLPSLSQVTYSRIVPGVGIMLFSGNMWVSLDGYYSSNIYVDFVE